MDDVVLKGFGFWLLTVVNAVIVFISYFIGHMANGFDPMLVSLIITILMSSEVLIVLIIKHFFKIPEKDNE